MRGHPNGAIDLTDQHPQDWEKFEPIKNGNGTWSFRSAHGTYLSALGEGRVCLQPHLLGSEMFTLEDW